MTAEQYINRQAVELAEPAVTPAYAAHLLGLIRPEHREAVRDKVYKLLQYKAEAYRKAMEGMKV